MPPTKNLILVAVLSGFIYLMLKLFLRYQEEKSGYYPPPSQEDVINARPHPR